MGVGASKEEEARLAAAVHKLSKVELKYIDQVFGELSYISEEGKRLIKRPTWLNRETFANKFGLPDFLGEQLFAAFDRDQNEVIDLDEFLVGMALCLHGSVKDKCQLLFKIFNLDGDEGITKEELSTVLISVLQSTHGLLKNFTSTDQEEGTVGWDMKISETVERIVRDAFDKCDVSRNGKLEINEFEHWLHKNPKLFDSVFMISCPRPADEPGNYDVITTPVSPNPPHVTSKTEITDDSSARLSDLFSNDVICAQDTDGQTFFDSLGQQSAPLVDSGALPSTLVSHADAGADASADAEESPRDPTVPEIGKDILSHHQILLNDEKLVARGSEMSLVSLGQSTGDLSSIDSEANSAVEPGDEAVDVDKGRALSGLPGDHGDQTAIISATRNTESDAGSWHPLQESNTPSSPDVSGDKKDELFQDASDVMEIEPIAAVESNLLTENIAVKINLDNDVDDDDVKPKSEATGDRLAGQMQADIENEVPVPRSTLDASTADISGDIDRKPVDAHIETALSNTAPDTDNEKPGLKELLETEASEFALRPKTLNVPPERGLLSVDLSPSEHAIGKPTLRQLAEMKEFDTSPSLEDSKSVLHEARFAAWQPSTETRNLIEATKRGNVIDKTHLTYPSVLLDTSMGDPVKDLVAKFLGEQEATKRPVPTADSVTMNDAGLRDLLEAQCWRGAVDWTAKYLTAHGQGLSSGSPTGPFNHTPKLLQIWFVRIALLYKLKSFSSAEAELNAFGNLDNPDLYYDFYPDLYQGMKGCLVPFSLRVIHAELPQHNGRPQETLDRLYRLLAIIKTVVNNLQTGFSEQGEEITLSEEEKAGALQLWDSRHVRILFAIGNCLLGNKEYNLALKIFNEIIKKKPETKSAIISGVGRLHLQLGDINLAKKYFKRVEQISLGDPKTLSITVMNRGFVALAEGKYAEAYENFQSVTKLNPENSSAWNNSAVCLLFQGKVKEASNLLETLIWKSPKHNLHEDIIFNLCTVYELETSRAFQKKQKLLDLVSRHKGDGFNIQSLKLT